VRDVEPIDDIGFPEFDDLAFANVSDDPGHVVDEADEIPVTTGEGAHPEIFIASLIANADLDRHVRDAGTWLASQAKEFCSAFARFGEGGRHVRIVRVDHDDLIAYGPLKGGLG